MKFFKKSFRQRKRNEWQQPVIVGLAIGLLCSAAVFFCVFETWSMRISDRLYLPRQVDPRIVIVEIDNAAIARLGRWPWDRQTHAEIINKISDAKPLAIGYDVSFSETSNTLSDKLLEQAIRDAGNVVLPLESEVLFDAKLNRFKADKLLPPLSMFAGAAARVGFVNTPQDVDGVVRRVPLEVVFPDGSKNASFAIQLARLALPKQQIDLQAVADSMGRMIINFANQPGKAFPSVSAADVMNSNVPNSFFNGKIVLVGATAFDLHDNQLVPTSAGLPMPGVEIHASILNTLLNPENYLFQAPRILVVLWMILIAGLLGLIIPRFRARWSIPIVIVLWLGSVIGALVLFSQGWIVDVLWPTITLFLAFGAIMLERRITADRQKKEIKSAFSRYVSETVVRSILDDPSKLHLGGERKNMTVLFSDIRGFTSVSEGLEPEKLVEIMNIYLSRMTDIVFKHCGVLDKYIGDAVMAFWNAPFDQPDHAKLAVETAIDMLSNLKDMNKEKAFGENEFHIGIGINTGDMVVGNMGSERRFDYTVIGDNVNLASRMESLTKQYHVELLISESTKNALGEGYVLRQVDLVAVKGKKEPVKLYEVIKRESEQTDEDKEFFTNYNKALEAYFAKDFVGALKLTDALIAKRPEDGPSLVINERAKHFLQEPPAADWSGTWVMTTK